MNMLKVVVVMSVMFLHVPIFCDPNASGDGSGSGLLVEELKTVSGGNPYHQAEEGLASVLLTPEEKKRKKEQEYKPTLLVEESKGGCTTCGTCCRVGCVCCGFTCLWSLRCVRSLIPRNIQASLGIRECLRCLEDER